MEVKIQAVHFDATEKLQEFATKKVEKLAKSYGYGSERKFGFEFTLGSAKM